ncbi:MAG: DUF2254 domain-containing protein [Acidimicrobiia bacterium]|nr:DUF2254 domain-containing protein [Acidimicrobiia bacterium]
MQAGFPATVVGPAAAHGAVVVYGCRVGDHVVAGSPIALVWADAGSIDAPRAARLADAGMRIGFERTFEQDVSFGVRQLVDIALRAMSPALNDPYTAVQSIQHITVVLCAAVPQRPGPRLWCDGSGTARVLLPMPGLCRPRVWPVARSSAHEPRVIGALLTMLAETRRRSSGDADHAAIQREIDLLHADAQRAILQPADLAVVTENRQQFMSPHPRP